MLKSGKKEKSKKTVTQVLAAEINTQEPDEGEAEDSVKTDTKPNTASKRKKQPPAPKEHKVINTLVGNLSLALEENVVEIDEMLDDDTKQQPKEYQNRDKKPAKYRFFLIFGLIVFWLAIMGALSVGQTIGELAYDISNQTALKEEFERFLFPVVVNDPPEFDGAENMPISVIISSAIWQIILTGDTSNYERDFQTLMIPENDVEAAARSIFGQNFDMRHSTVDNIIIAFIYDADIKSYIVPENPTFNTFSPKVSEILNNGESYRIIVEYITPTPHLIAGIEFESQSVKTMIYTITRAADRTKTIQSIELNRGDEDYIHF
ncbi:MAG: hypothetical protein FWG70_10495 [Oscillospiraceae bacterium]|nr:hypothetical protein [Oscillospiraceae bacterium]